MQRKIVEVELLAAVEAYLLHTGESQSAFTRRVCGDPNLVTDLRNGRGLGPALRRKIEAALATTERKRAMR
jgi:hypothetical protein